MGWGGSGDICVIYEGDSEYLSQPRRVDAFQGMKYGWCVSLCSAEPATMIGMCEVPRLPAPAPL